MLRVLAKKLIPLRTREWIRWSIGRPTPYMAPRGPLHPNWAAEEFMQARTTPESGRSLRRSRFVAEFVSAATAPLPSARLLDVGCGWGRLQLRLEELGVLDRIEYTGLEAGAATVAAARAAFGAEVVEGSIEALPFADNSFDVVVALNVLETLPSFELGLAEILRVSRWLIVVAGHGPSNGASQQGHLNNPGVGWYEISLWNPAELRRTARERGAAYAWSLNDITRDDPELLNVSAFLKAS